MRCPTLPGRVKPSGAVVLTSKEAKSIEWSFEEVRVGVE
jgi:hypothetical protein